MSLIFLRQLIQDTLQSLLELEGHIGAGHYERTPQRGGTAMATNALCELLR